MIKIFLCIILFHFSLVLFGQENSTLYRFGIEAQYDLLSQRDRGGNINYFSPQGYGLRLGGFYERNLTNRVRASAGVRFFYKHVNKVTLERISNLGQNQDSLIFKDQIGFDRRKGQLMFPLTLRFDYISDPKLYFLIAAKPFILLFQQDKFSYLSTNIENLEGDIVDETISSDPVLLTSNSSRSFTLGYEIGLGVELKNFAFEIILDDRIEGGSKRQGLGFRLRYSFLKKIKN